MVPLSAEIVEQRLSIFVIYANSIMSAPEAVLESRNTKEQPALGTAIYHREHPRYAGSHDHTPAIQADGGEALRNARPGRDNR